MLKSHPYPRLTEKPHAIVPRRSACPLSAGFGVHRFIGDRDLAGEGVSVSFDRRSRDLRAADGLFRHRSVGVVAALAGGHDPTGADIYRLVRYDAGGDEPVLLSRLEDHPLRPGGGD